MPKNQNKVPDFFGMAERLKKDTVRYASIHGLNFFKDSFQKGGFTDAGFSPWEPRKNNADAGRAILVQKGYLRDSLHVVHRSIKKIVFGSDAEYAEIHNEGGTIQVPVTARSRRFFWYMYKSTGLGKWKAMALTKKRISASDSPNDSLSAKAIC